MAEQDRTLADTFVRESTRLRRFIRRRVADAGDAEDILQDVFEELVEAARLLRPVEQVGAWLFRVARNRIADLLRRKRTRGIELSSPFDASGDDPGEDPFEPSLDDWLPAPGAGPEAAYARRLLLDELAEALDELPEEQRSVFVAHEIDGRSFRQLSAETGVGVNTLLSRKRYAVLYLRRRLQAIHDEVLDREE